MVMYNLNMLKNFPKIPWANNRQRFTSIIAIILLFISILGASALKTNFYTVFSLTGKSLVEEKLPDIKLVLSLSKNICTEKDEKNNFDCYSNYYDNLTKTAGIQSTFIDLKERFNTDTYVKTQCHQLIHTIGNVAAENFETISEAFAKGDNFCWSGYYHGVMEGYIAKIGSKNLPSWTRGAGAV